MIGTTCLARINGVGLSFEILLRSQFPRLFSLQTKAAAKQLPPRIQLSEKDVREAFVHGTGPGGQKINKTACAVQLKHLPTGIVTRCQETRSRSQNRTLAWRKLAEKVEAQEKGSESRTAIKAQVKVKKKASKSKKARRKYKALERDNESLDADELAHEDSQIKPDLAETREELMGEEQRVG